MEERIPAERNGGKEYNPIFNTTQVELQIKHSVIKARRGKSFLLFWNSFIYYLYFNFVCHFHHTQTNRARGMWRQGKDDFY